MINITELKAAMKTAGYDVSAGDTWTVRDGQQYKQYCYHEHNGMIPNRDVMALAYPGIAPEGFPGTGDSPAPDPDRELVSIAITGNTEVDIEESDTTQLTATATYDDDSTADVTDVAEWSSDDDEVATVVTGEVTCLQGGTVTITASIGEISDSTEITITAPPEMINIDVSGDTDLEVSDTTQLTARAVFSDESTVVLEDAVWSSEDTEIATVTQTGEATALSAGQVDIIATYGELSGAATLTITE